MVTLADQVNLVKMIKKVIKAGDALQRQIVPCPEEQEGRGIADFCQERDFFRGKFLIHKYPDRAVILATNQCFEYCRFCFRRNLWREPAWKIQKQDLKQIADYLRKHTEIKEIIISGGDPLALTNQELVELVKLADLVKPVKLIRIATRALTFCPARIDSGLVRIIKQSRKQIWFISHFNHPVELNSEAVQGIKKLKDTGVPLLNQTVLLRGVNAQVKILLALFRELSSLGVKPYYLFQCDPVPGAAHFATELSDSLGIYQELNKYSGIILPRFAFELPGYGKVSPGPGWRIKRKARHYEVMTPEGEKYQYPVNGKCIALIDYHTDFAPKALWSAVPAAPLLITPATSQREKAASLTPQSKASRLKAISKL